jgi:general stress protein YciG
MRNQRSSRNDRSRDSQGRFKESNRGGYSNYDTDYDEDYRGRGWSGDSEGHSEAAERGWENRRGGSQSNYDNDYDRDYEYESEGRSGRGRGRGWSGDSQGHSEAAERGWENRRGGSQRDYDDDDDYAYANEGRSGRGRGWSGDSEGHSEAAERGWENRRGGSQRSDYDSNDDYDRDFDYESDGRSGRGRGWSGDSQGHSEAARKGWENRGGGSSRRNDRRSSSSRSNSTGNSRRGFAAMDPEEVSEIASMGGKAAHRSGHAHEWDSREARRAGHLGGIARWSGRRTRSSQY